jgi:hypothetical protein
VKRFAKVAWDMARTMIAVVDVVREGDYTNREVQCQGEKDETETGREEFRAAWNLGPGGVKHRARKGEKGLLLRVMDGILVGMVDDAHAPTDLDEGETAIFNAADTGGTSQVRCKGTIIQIGSGSGGIIIRLDRFTTWWNATPKVNFSTHVHPGVMPGPSSTAVTATPLGDVSNVESTEGHQVK